jgi:hypothetical protein
MTAYGTVFHLGVSLALLWLLAYVGWRPYRLDNIRNDFFILRNELFIYAATDKVSFDNPAYMILRDRINAMIRFSHMLSITRGAMFYALHQRHPLPKAKDKEKLWQLGLEQLPPEARTKLIDISNQLSRRSARQLVTGVPPLLLLVVIYSLILAIGRLFRSNDEDTGLRIAKELGVQYIEESAEFAQQHERDERSDRCLTLA